MRVMKFAVVLMTTVVALLGWSCTDEPEVKPNVEKPTIGIMEVEFDASTMTAKVMIAPSTDATAWYWRVEGGSDTLDETFTKVDGAVAQEISFSVVYGTEYTIKAYAENKAGNSDIVEKKFCAMPEGEVSISIGDITLTEEEEVVVTIYPSKDVTSWYWASYSKESEPSEWNEMEGNAEQTITIPLEWNVTCELCVYAVCGEIESERVTKEYYFELSVPTISVSKPIFDEEAMTVSFDVTPSEDTHFWLWGIDGEDTNREEGAESKRVTFDVEYDVNYVFTFVACNKLDVADPEKIVNVEFTVISPIADIAIENLTAFSLDAVITKKEHCARYVAGAVHTSAYDRNVFIEQAQSSLNPDPSYPFAVFNSATESRTFSEQDLVHNALTDSSESAGIELRPGTSYTIAVYGEDAEGHYNVSTKEVVIPQPESTGLAHIYINDVSVTETSAEMTISSDENCKYVIGFVDPVILMSDSDNPVDIYSMTSDEVAAYLLSIAQGKPYVYTTDMGQVKHLLSDRLEIDHHYYAYAIAIKDGQIGDIAVTTFTTLRPSLTGIAKITAATIVEQTSHEKLTVTVTPDNNALFVRIYAAPSADHAAYADMLEYVLDADDYQNYRGEYEIIDGVATANIDIYHPGDNYYIYATAVDYTRRAGEMVCVAQLAGLDTEYYTTMEEVIAEGALSYYGTGDATMNVDVISQDGDTINVIISATNFSDNVEKVWFMRFANCLIDNVTNRVKQDLSEYSSSSKIKGSYKEVTEGTEYRYETDLSNSFNPTYNGLLVYDDTYGGDIVAMVILDTDGKVKIHSYYAAGRNVVVMP